MNKKKCEVCGSSHTVKNGARKGVQLYKCQECGYQFRAGVVVSEEALWDAYQQEKQTIKELSVRFGISVATVKRRLHDIKREWVQPSLSGEGFVHLDVTYWGRGFGVLLCIGQPDRQAAVYVICEKRNSKRLRRCCKQHKGTGILYPRVDNRWQAELVQDILRIPYTDVPVPHEADYQAVSDAESQNAGQQGVERLVRQASQGRRE